MRRQPFVFTSVLALMAALGLTACGSSSGSGNGPVSVAAMFPFSGGSAFIGQIANSAIYPCVREVNKSGGLLGHQVAVDDIDTKNDPADALTLAERWVATTSNIFFILGPSTTEAPTLAPILNNDKIVMLSSAGENEFDRTNLKYFWRMFPPDSENGIAMALTAKSLGITRVAAVFGSDQGSQGDLPGALAGIKAAGLDLVAEQSLTPDQPSYQAQVARVLAAKPQAIFTEADPTSATTFFGEMVHQPGGSGVRIIGSQATVVPSWTTPVQGAVGKSLFQSLYLGVSAQSATANPATALFNSALNASGASVPNPKQYIGNPYAMLGYDSCIAAALAAVDAHSYRSPVYNDFIPQVTNPGPGKTVVYSYAEGVRLLKQGKKIQYVGAAGPIDFNKYHNSSGGQVAENLTSSGTLSVIKVISFQQISRLG